MTLTLGVPGQIMPPAAKAVQYAQRAEADGFDAVWWPCHLMGWHPNSLWRTDVTPLAGIQNSPHTHFDPLSMMAAVGAVTERIRVGVAVTDTIRRHPAMLAMEALTVDHLAAGRAILGLGSGERLNLTPYGIEFEKPVARLAEAIEVIRLLWSTDQPVDFSGRFFSLRDAVLGLEPFEGRTPPIWLAAHGPRMLELCGSHGDGWIPTKYEPEEYAQRLATIHRAAEEAGRDPGAVTPSMLAYVLCAPDEESLERMCEHPLVRLLCILLPAKEYRAVGAEPPFEGESGFHSFVPTTVARAEAERIAMAIPPALVRRATFHGDANQIAAQVRAYEQAGMRDLVLWNVTAFADPALASYSFKVLRELRELL
jgi:phthiodiolone/phenolphthiodiolone dimycocerosates ketoreductase